MAEESAVARYLAEFVGTYLLVFTVGCNVLTGDPTWNATSIACVLMVSIYALGDVSGANFNPAVSFTLALSKKLAWKEAGIYCAVQITAGIIAALSYGAMFWEVFNLGPQMIKEGVYYSWWQACLAEFLYTFMLCFVVLNCATAAKNDGNQFFGLAIGFVIIAGGYAAGGISGGAFNPAVAIGVDTASAGYGFGWCLAYTVCELLGAAAASGLFRVVRPDEFGGDFNYGLPAKLCSEFLGTFYLVLTVGLNVVGGSPAAVWSIAASLMCMIYALGNCSGAHFNPAVTLAILCSRRNLTNVGEAAAYMGVQIFGGILAAFTYTALMNGKTAMLWPNEEAGFNWGHAAVAEIVFTFVLCYVVLCVATVKEPSKDMFGLAIASCVTAGGYAIGVMSGGSLNPAVSFGIASSNIINGGLFFNCLIYTVFEFLGAGLAAGVFMITHPGEFK